MTPAVSFENISKQYRLGQVGVGTLSQDFKRVWAKLRGKPDPFTNVGASNVREVAGGEFVWALREVNFDVKEGEVFGIIGRNGAGKSTLLKLLSRVTAPTTGLIRAKGRIAALLEVGTGFHPELTGRENIFLNGSILGMTKLEIARRLEEIVEFSGCGKYIDTPVKRYSSGMTVRLGFAIAAHLECEILVIDEVLAVGDASFQAKCIGRMSEVAARGKTVLFVSHNMQAVERLCSRACVIEAGMVTMIGDVHDAIAQYFRSFTGLSLGEREVSRLQSNRGAKFCGIRVRDEYGNECVSFRKGQKVHLVLEIEVHGSVPQLCVVVRFMSGVTRQEVTSVKHMFTACESYVRANQPLEIEVDTASFRPGIYPLNFWLGDPSDRQRAYDEVDNGTLPLVISDDGNGNAAQGIFDIDSRVLVSSKA
jgi:lipopolysaccharide transport system ATP-binding protein